VQPGDTLAGLAQRLLGDSGRYCDLAAWNGITPPYLLRVGQEIRFPAAEATSVQQAPGQPDGGARPQGSQGASVHEALQGADDREEGAGGQPARSASEALLLSDDGGLKEERAPEFRNAHPLLRVWGSLTRLARKLWPF
jgi:nucleoid-associated protein YgaU